MAQHVPSEYNIGWLSVAMYTCLWSQDLGFNLVNGEVIAGNHDPWGAILGPQCPGLALIAILFAPSREMEGRLPIHTVNKSTHSTAIALSTPLYIMTII